MIARDLLATARRLATATQRKPKQADLRRAFSTAYYALFHALANDAANLLVGNRVKSLELAWTQTYRALNHGAAKSACEQIRQPRFPEAICTTAKTFVILQQRRHDADYDPILRFTRGDALAAIAMAEQAVANMLSCETVDRRAFAVMLLLQRR